MTAAGVSRGAHQGILAAVLVIGALQVPKPVLAFSKPDWLEAFEAKAAEWQEKLDAAAKRVESAADQASVRASSDLQARIADAREMLHQQREGLDLVLAKQATEWQAALLVRLEELTGFADDLGRDLEEIAKGTRQHLSVEVERLQQGVRESIERALEKASAELFDARLVNGELVARAFAQGRRQARRWTGIVLIFVGVLAAGLIVPSLRTRRLTFGIPIAIAVLAIIGAGLAIGEMLPGFNRAGEPVALGLQTCPALGEAQEYANRFPGGAPSTELERGEAIRRELLVCQTLAAEPALAQLVHHQIEKVVKTMGRH